MEKVIPGIIRASSKGNPREQICLLTAPVCRVSVVVKLCDHQKFAIGAGSDPSAAHCSPGRWGMQLKAGKGDGKSFACQEPTGQGFCNKKKSVKRCCQIQKQSRTEKSECAVRQFGWKRCAQGLAVPGQSREHGPMGMCCNLGRN